MYELRKDFPGVVRLSDGAWIPADNNNKDWRSYQAWLAAKKEPLPVPSDKELEDRKDGKALPVFKEAVDSVPLEVIEAEKAKVGGDISKIPDVFLPKDKS